MYHEVVLANPTRSSLRISMYIGSITVMICFFSALCTVLYVLNYDVASSQRCFSALICADVPPPSMVVGARPGNSGFSHVLIGAIIS
jgi:ABC-type spermidine/putrescine transport system permease subunit II